MSLDRRRFIAGVGAAVVGAIASSPTLAAIRAGRPEMFGRALAALDRHGDMIPCRDVVALVDFTAPSGQPRLQLVDTEAGMVTRMLVAHGSGSDPSNSGWVERLSNLPGSNASCGGSFVTGDIYHGKHGASRRLIGLDSENSLADERGIVIHAAGYVDPQIAQAQGRVGRSQGCFAVSHADIFEVLERLGPGRLLFASR